jgi:Uncharacterised nucleotidyltransferase
MVVGSDNDTLDMGRLMIETLEGSWRVLPAPEARSAASISHITSQLLNSGTAGLVWWRLQSTAPQLGDLLSPFEQAYTYYTVRAAFHEAQARRAFALFRDHDIEPVLVKGWAIGRRYPVKGLRPYGDLDLCVRESDYKRAVQLAATPEGQRLSLDLHEGLKNLDSRCFDEFFERTQMIELGDTRVRIPSDEDLLRIVCLHLLKHGGWRPLQFCDVALLVEVRSPEFRWDLCVGQSRRDINWISTAIGLAHQLVGADIEGYPYAAQARRVPRWMIAQVLKSWTTPEPLMNAPYKYGKPMREYLRQPRGLLAALMRRWPNPIEATYALNGSFNNLPRFPYQLAEGLRRAARFLSARV